MGTDAHPVFEGLDTPGITNYVCMIQYWCFLLTLEKTIRDNSYSQPTTFVGLQKNPSWQSIIECLQFDINYKCLLKNRYDMTRLRIEYVHSIKTNFEWFRYKYASRETALVKKYWSIAFSYFGCDVSFQCVYPWVKNV